MPLYVYECRECEIEIEERRSAERADDLVECPICHGLCQRTIASFSIVDRSTNTQPVYGQIPRSYHGVGCACCTPRRR
jgi:putative FmdB family regulatory protein